MSTDSNPNLTLESLVGPHWLHGVDADETDYRHSSVVRFKLGRKTYVATEDPSDEYRSYLDSLKESDEAPKNTFEPVKVTARMREGYDDRVLELVNKDGAVILAVGTENVGDYYPSWVGNYWPENL